LIAATVLTIATRHEVGKPARNRPRRVDRVSPSQAQVLLMAALFLAPAAARVEPAPVPGRLDAALPGGRQWRGAAQARQRPSAGTGGSWAATRHRANIAQSFGALAFVPMLLFGERVGYHVLHVVVFHRDSGAGVGDVGREDSRGRLLAGAFTCFFTAGYFATIGKQRRHQLADRRLLLRCSR
jgi:hypothetical protein